MSTDALSTVPTTLPEGFAEWALSYFGKKLNDYLHIRNSCAPQLHNAAKDPELKKLLDKELKACDEEENVSKLQKLISQCTSQLSVRRREVELKVGKLHDETIFAKLDLRRDPNEARETITDFLKSWDIAEAEREVKLWEEQVKRAKSTHLGDTDVVQKRHEKFKLQNDKYARNAHQAKSIATRLINEKGELNLEESFLKDLPFNSSDDLPKLMQEIKEGKHPDLPQSEHALAMLQKLKNNEDLRNKLTAVAKPTKQDGEAANLIRMTLGLKPDEEVTDAHARQAALSGLLFQARQGQVGSCFTTATACMVQRNRPEQFLEDITNLFSNGKLTRTIRHGGTLKTIEVPLNKTLLQGNLEKKTEVKRKDSDLHMAPEFVAGMDALDIPADEQEAAMKLAARQLRAEQAVKNALAKLPEEVFTTTDTREAVMEDVLKKLQDDSSISIRNALDAVFSQRGMTLYVDTDMTADFESTIRRSEALSECDDFDDDNKNDSFKPEDLLSRMAKTRLDKDKQDAAVKKARDAYLGQQDNLVMRAWEYSVATMVEKMPGANTAEDKMKRGVGETTKSEADGVVNGAGLPPLDRNELLQFNALLVNEFNDLVKASLNTRYDPSVKKRSEAVSQDGHSSSGGYCLFLKDGGKEEKIASESDYKNAMEKLLKQALKNIEGGLTQYQKDQSSAIVNFLADRFGESDFHDKIVESSTGVTSTDTVKQKEEKKDTMSKPWTYESGGNTDNLLQIYYNSETPLQTTVAPNTCNDAEKLGKFILKSLKDLKVDKKAGLDDSSSVPVRTVGVHAFNLTPGNPALLALMRSHEKPDDAINEFKNVEVAKRNHRGEMEVSLKTPLTGLAKKMIADAVSIFEETDRGAAATAVGSAVLSGAGDKMSLADLQNNIRAKLREYLVNVFGLDAGNADKFADMGADKAAGGAVDSAIPVEEFKYLLRETMERLSVSDEVQNKVRDKVLAALKGKNVMPREDFAKLITDELKAAKFEVEQKQVETALEHKVPKGLPIADGNWGDGDTRTLMSLVVNPRTGVLELWQMDQDGGNAFAMNQKDWVQDHRWQVFSDPSEYEGVLGDNAWETKRGDAQAKIDDCAKEHVGDVGMMQNALEIAEARQEEGKTAEADKAIERVNQLAAAALKTAANRKQARQELDAFEKELAKVAIPETKPAVARVKALAASLNFIRNDEDVKVVLTEHAELCKLLKAGQAALGVAVDVETILKQTA